MYMLCFWNPYICSILQVSTTNVERRNVYHLPAYATPNISSNLFHSSTQVKGILTADIFLVISNNFHNTFKVLFSSGQQSSSFKYFKLWIQITQFQVSMKLTFKQVNVKAVLKKEKKGSMFFNKRETTEVVILHQHLILC